MAPVLPLLAQTAIPDSLLNWLTGSAVTVLAFVVVGFLRRWIVTGAELQRCQDKLDAAEAEIRARNQEARETLVPTLTKALVLLSRFADRHDATPNPPTKGQG